MSLNVYAFVLLAFAITIATGAVAYFIHRGTVHHNPRGEETHQEVAARPTVVDAT